MSKKENSFYVQIWDNWDGWRELSPSKFASLSEANVFINKLRYTDGYHKNDSLRVIQIHWEESMPTVTDKAGRE